MKVLKDVLLERFNQFTKWGEQNHPSFPAEVLNHREDWKKMEDFARRICDAATKAGTLSWMDILNEELHEAYAADNNERLREELVQLAAVAVAWIDSLDRGGVGVDVAQPTPHSLPIVSTPP